MRAVDCGCAPGHHMEVTTQTCADCGLTEREIAETGSRPCRCRWCDFPVIRGVPCGCPRAQEEARRIRAAS